MKKTSKKSVFFLTLCVLAFVACDKSTDDKPDNSETVFRTSVNDQFTINLEQPSEIIFEGSAVTAGYSWRWENRDKVKAILILSALNGLRTKMVWESQ